MARTPPSPIFDRCKEDATTRLRLRYAPYYHHFTAQRGMRVTFEGRERVLLSSNDYLGLGWHPRVQEASRRATEQWGTSTTGSRMANGSRAFHLELEDDLAQFLGCEAAQVSAAGYLSCLAAVAAFSQRGDIILADRNLHSCMWDGIRLSGAEVERFAHNDPADLERVLAALDPSAPKLLAIEGVYSMEGHVARLPELLDVAERHKCFVALDDAHGFGVLGPKGRGTAASLGVEKRVHLVCGSLSKALASTGGFIAGDRCLIEHLRTHSKHTIFSAAISPGQAGAARAALSVLQEEPAHQKRLWENTARYRTTLQELGLDTWGSQTPAIPIVLGSKEKAYFFWKSLLDHDVFSVISTAPAVPPGKDLIRTAISAAHTDDDLEVIARALRKAR